MAAKRRAFPSTPALASLGLCLTLSVAVVFSLMSVHPDHSLRAANRHFGHWFGRAMYQIGAEFELLLHGGQHKASGTNPAGQVQKTAPGAGFDPAAALGVDITGLREAMALYKAGELTQGDAVAQTARSGLVRTTLAWVALSALGRDKGFSRMQAFLDTHPGWPARDTLERRMEEMLYVNNASADQVEDFFFDSAPETVLGRLALARAFKNEGDNDDAQRLVRAVWHDAGMSAALTTKVKTEFASELDPRDFRIRAHYLLYDGESEAALRAASAAGPNMPALAKLFIAARNNGASDKMFAAIPKAARGDPAYIFAKILKLRHAKKFKEAAALMLSITHETNHLVNGDAWWEVQRDLARKLLDLGEPILAYKLCAEASPVSNKFRIEAEFQAGWIALRFLKEPDRAAKHFTAAAFLARTPISIARATYWQGRAAEASRASGAALRAKGFYETAAAQSATYYGQLARERLGLKTIPLRSLEPAATGQARNESIRVIELLYALGEKDFAYPLAIAAAKHMESQSQIAALAKIIEAQHDAHAALVIGKILERRRMPIDNLAFPTYGVPDFDPVKNSASQAIVYAIARQESAFNTRAVSTAGAKGLMQMIATTAKRTAERAGIDFDVSRLVDDAAFNAKLGAAHLGALLVKEKGCPILVFAAYNAGGGRVKQWISAYGDPRSPNVDPVDWVERIPFAETRNYVQRVMENLMVYEASFGEAPHAEMLRKVQNARL
ncbi:MAG: lytic transglycosylase domain-containing protein [Beijerinckiaceae bacterium]|nr:MAG: lytic transglycosylase domain-containing protein [Beijerinckiaceae bacterium]